MRADGKNVSEGSWGLGRVAGASLVPWAAFMTAAIVGDAFVQDRTLDVGGMLRSSPFYLWVIALFSFFPVVAGRSRRVQAAATLVMTTLAVWAGLTAVAVDDGQAGLSVLIIPPAGLVLAVLVLLGQAVARFRSREP